MKPTARLRSYLFAASSLLAISSASAETWVPTATGTYSWNTNANWTPSTFPNATSATADLNIDIAAAQTINLNTAITAGILNIGDSTGNSAITLATGTSGSLTFNNGGTSQLNHGISTAVDTISAQVTLADNLQITNSGATANKNNAFTLSGKITGAGGITLNTSNGLVYLSNTTNDYSGGFTLNTGATVLTGGNSNAFGTGTVTINGGSLTTAFNGAASQPITTSNTNVWNGNWTLITDTSSKVITFNGAVTLGANVAVTANQFLVLNNNISQTGSNRVLTMNGSGSMTLNGTNTYNGGSTITTGRMQFGKLVSMPATGTVAAATATTLTVGLGGTGEWTTGTSGNGTLGGLISATTGSLGGQAGSTVNWAGTATVGFDTTNATSIQNYTGNIVNRATTLGVTKLGGGALTLSGANTYTGATTVNGGILNMSGTFGNHAITVNGGLLNFTSTAGGNGAVTINGGTLLFAGTKSGGAISLTASGTLQIGTATPANLGGGQIVITGAISSDSTTARTVSNRFVMNGSITLGSATNTGKLTFTDTTNTSTVGSAVRILTVLSDVEFAKAFFNGGGGGIQKEAGATMTISGGNSPYTGATIVNSGVLALGNLANLNGTATLGTAVTVNNGGTFGVRQNASATTNAIGQVGQTTASTLTLNAGSAVSMTDTFTSTLNLTGTASLAPATGAAPVLTFDLIGADTDLLAITGAATVGAGTARIAVSPSSTPTAGTSFTVITAASGLNTNFTLANPLLSSANGLMSLAFTGSTATSQIVAVSDDPNALYWSGATDGDWNTATNWNTSVAGGGAGSVPGASNNVTFSTTAPVAANLSNSLSAALTVNSINFLPATSAVTVAGSAITVSTDINDNSAANQTINAPLTVTGRINKTGAGVLTLAGSNAISGTTALDNGTLQLQNANAITATSGITSATTSAVNMAAGTTINLRANANTSFNTGRITLPHGAVNIDVNNSGSGSGNTLTLGTALNTVAGGIFAFTTSGNSSTTLNITGGNSYGLATGRIQNPTGVAGTAFTVNAGTVPVAILQFQTGSFGSNFIAGSGTITLGTSSTSGIAQGANGSNVLTVNSGATLILAGGVTNYNGRTGGNYGAVLNSGGTLVVNHAAALTNSGGGTNVPTLIINGGTLDNTSAAAITVTGNPAQTWNGDFTYTGTRALNLGNGAVTMVGSRTVTVTTNFLTIGGPIAGAGLTKAGAGTLSLGGANTYSGDTTVSAGTLELADNAQLRFILGTTSGTNNSLTGAGTATLNGDFTIDTSAADSLVSGSWTLENVSILTGGAYGTTFTVIGFTDAGSDNWTKVVGPKTYTYNESSGILTLTSGAGSPEINVNQGGDIANGGSKSFGTVTLGSNTSPVFAINNTGTAALNLTGTAPDYVAVSGANASDFIVTAQPTTPVTSGGGTTNFTVQFTPSGAGLRNATLTILNNDSDEGSFTINVSGTGQTLYDAWSGGANFDLDANNDGVKNGLAWLLGAADVNANAIALLPTIDNTDPTHFIFTYRRKDDANNPLYTTIAAQYGTNLTGWTTAVDNADIDIVETDNHYSSSPGVDRVVVRLKRSTLAPDGKLFVRLNAVKVP